jgi:hypothetical protein
MCNCNAVCKSNFSEKKLVCNQLPVLCTTPVTSNADDADQTITQVTLRRQSGGRPDTDTSLIDMQHERTLVASLSKPLCASSLGASKPSAQLQNPLAWQHATSNVFHNEDTPQRPMSGQGARHLRKWQHRRAGLQPGGRAHALLRLVATLLRQPDVPQLAPAAHARGAVSAAMSPPLTVQCCLQCSRSSA